MYYNDNQKELHILFMREIIEVESCLGMCLAYVYIKHNVKIPKEQIPLSCLEGR